MTATALTAAERARYANCGRALRPHVVDWHPDIPSADECQRLVGTLSAAELLTLRLLVRGWRPAQIAIDRGVTVTTVRSQIFGAISRFGVSGQPQAIAVLLRAGVA